MKRIPFFIVVLTLIVVAAPVSASLITWDFRDTPGGFIDTSGLSGNVGPDEMFTSTDTLFQTTASAWEGASGATAADVRVHTGGNLLNQGLGVTSSEDGRHQPAKKPRKLAYLI